MLCLLAGCGMAFGSAGGSDSFYQGRVTANATAIAPPLTLQVWRVDYGSGSSFQSGGTSYVSPSVTRVYLHLKNDGASTITLFQTEASPNGSPPPSPPYYLVDQKGRRYRDTGSGWSSQVGDPRAVEGKALSGQTVEFTLEFGGIPEDVTSLRLVMDGVRAADGSEYNLEVALPLPVPAPSPTPE